MPRPRPWQRQSKRIRRNKCILSRPAEKIGGPGVLVLYGRRAAPSPPPNNHHAALHKGIMACVGEGLSCPPSCRPIPGHCRAHQSGYFLETGLLHPPLAALRRFPLLRAMCHCEPVTVVTGVAIRIPVPKAPLPKGDLFKKRRDFFSNSQKIFQKVAKATSGSGILVVYYNHSKRKTGFGPNHNKEELYNEEMGMFCLRLCARG